MSLLFHQFRKDCRSLRLLLALWAVLIAAQSLLVATAGLGATNWIAQIGVRMLSLVLPMLQALLVLIIVPLLVHQEPLVGTTAAWLTRPISRPMLLASKGFFVLTWLVLPPLAAELALLATSGVEASDMALAAAEIVLTQCALAASAGALASVTPSFVRFVVWGAAMYGASMLAGVLLVVGRLQGQSAFWSLADPEQLRSRSVLVLAIAVLVGGTVVVHQYLTRRTRRSVGLLVTGVVILLVLPELWRPALSAAPAASLTAPESEPIEVQVDPSGVYARDEISLRQTPQPRKTVSATSECRGTAADVFCTLEELQAQLLYPDGTRVSVQREARPSFMLFSQRALEGVLAASVVNAGPNVSRLWELFEIDGGTYAVHSTVPARLDGQATLRVKRYRIAAELPLQPGATQRSGSEQLVITDVLRGRNSLAVVLREQRLNLLFSRRPFAGPFVMPMLGDRTLYALLNREKGQVFLINWPDQFQDWSSMFGSQQRLSHQARVLNFSSESRYERVPELDDAWLRGAVLVRVETVDLGRLTRAISVSNFVMEADPLAAASAPDIEPGLTPVEYYERGAARLEDALDDPSRRDVELAEAKAYLQKAVAGDHKAAEADPQVKRAYATLALLAAVSETEPKKRRAGAKGWLDRAGAAGNDPAAERVEAFLVQREGGDPEGVLEQALTRSPKLASHWRDLGYFYGQHYRLRRALNAFDQALTLAPAPNEAALTHARRGAACAFSGRHSEAQAAYARAVALRPKDARSWGRLCEVRLEGNDCQGARQAATRAIELRNEYSWRSCLLRSQICLGAIEEDGPLVRTALGQDRVLIGDFYRDRGDDTKAAAYYERASRGGAEPALQIALSERALRQDYSDKAWTELQPALSRHADHPAVLAQAAAVRWQAGDKERARALAAQALETSFDSKTVARLDRSLATDPEYRAARDKARSRIEALLTHYERKYDYQYLRRDKTTVQWAIDRLGATHKDAEAVPPLVRWLAESVFDITRAKAADALWYIGDRRAVAPLVAALQDPSLKVRGFAASGLGDLGDPAAIEPLLDLFGRLQDNREETKARIADALGKLGDRRAIAPIRASLQTITDPAYVRWARPALTRLEGAAKPGASR